MKNPSEKGSEHGIAIITVISVLALLSLLTLTIISTSKICAISSKGNSIASRSMLLSESAANRIYWLLLNDRKNFPNRTIGEDDYHGEGQQRVMADGTIRQLNCCGSTATFTITDMQNGLIVSGSRPGWQLQQQARQPFLPAKRKHLLETVYNRLMDYVDRDSLVRLNSMESDGYRELNLPNLPRNRPMQLREELLFIPDADKIFHIDQLGRLSSAMLIAPRGLPQPPRTRPNIFTLSPAAAASIANLSEEERQQVVNALQKWRKNHTPLSQSLPPAVLLRLKQQFSFRESGYYTIIARAASMPHFSGVPLVISIKIGSSIPAEGRHFYEWTLY